MSFMDDFNKEADDILKQRDIVAKSFSLELHESLVSVTPVDTGNLKGAWTWDAENNKYVSTNNMEYATVIDGGRREINGKMQGSEQLPHGFQPIVERSRKVLQTKLKAIK